MEDLQRFPAESLHSFSFARQSEDFLHSRQAIIQKSIEFVRDTRGLKANAAIANAQAKVSGDAEIQDMMNLLKKAKVVPSLDINAANIHGLGLGPLTGPAVFNGSNVFEQSFGVATEPEEEGFQGLELPPQSFATLGNESAIIDSPEMTSRESRPQSPTPPRRHGLKRTYTDVNLASLQAKLIETLAQPYTPEESPVVRGSHAVSFLADAPAPKVSTTQHMHAPNSKWAPPAQAFFRTDADTPWTIVAANDLACLTFGVTRAEVRSLSILGLILQERRQWLENRLKGPEPIADPPKSPEVSKPPTSNLVGLGGKGGITSRLLSKAPSRLAKTQSTQADDVGGRIPNPPVKNHIPRKSRGVLLCGEILPIQKRNGTISAASFWVMEKRGGLIWIIEEVIEDVAYLEYESSRRLASSRGDTENIWGEELRSGIKLRYLIPKLSFDDMDNPAFDGEPVLGWYTASTMGGVNVPTCVAKVQGKPELRISSLPNIAGVMVLQPDTLIISSSNSIFSQALFGYDQPNGMHIDRLIPNFGSILDLLTEEEDDDFWAEGLVIPEHSFRRARALLTLRDGAEDAASIFLRPAGLPARHRDGSDIMVDVQMRLVRSESALPPALEDVIAEDPADEAKPTAVSQMVYALWVTYSRQLHSAGMGVKRPEHPLMSRPATPPAQIVPAAEALPSPPPTIEKSQFISPPISRQPTRDSSPAEPLEHPLLNTAHVAHPKKTINDFVILEEMGSGAYGEVKLARYKTSRNSKVVIKYVTKKKILVDTWIRDRRLGTTPLEIHVLDFLRRDGYRHPNIVEMVDFFEDDVNYYIEMLPHGLPGMDLFVSFC